jgi:hypothetical protein
MKWLYKPKESKLKGRYDFVIPLDYGTINGNRLLPNASIKGIKKAVEIFKNDSSQAIVWTSAPFGSPLEKVETEKLEIISSLSIDSSVVKRVGECTNSITEAEQILNFIPNASRIIIVCDWRHARRTKRIWKYYFKGELAIVTTDTQWNQNHKSPWCRSNFRWLLANILHHVLLICRGVNALKNTVHTLKVSALS